MVPHPGFGRGLVEALDQLAADRPHGLDDRLLPVYLQHRPHRREGVVLRPVGGRDEEHLLPVFMMDAAQFHDLPPAGKRRHREAVAETLAEGAEVGLDTVIGLGAVEVPAESRHHLVQDEHRAVVPAQPGHLVQEIVDGMGEGRRLHDQAGDAAGMIAKQRLDAFDVVVVEGNAEVFHRLRNAGVAGGGGDEPVVVGEERMVLAQRHHVAPGVGAGQLDRRRGHRRAVLGELDHLGAGDEIDQVLGQFALHHGGTDEIRALFHLLDGGIDHRLDAIAKADGAQGHRPVEVFVAVRIPDGDALAALDIAGGVGGELVVALGIGVGAAGNEPVGEGQFHLFKF